MAIVPNRSFQKEFLTKNQNFYKQSLHNKPCRLAFITILQLDYITLQFRHKKKYSATIFLGTAASFITPLTMKSRLPGCIILHILYHYFSHHMLLTTKVDLPHS